jgi:hypothetical protein
VQFCIDCARRVWLALRAADISPATADVLVDEVLNLLHQIARTAAN